MHRIFKYVKAYVFTLYEKEKHTRIAWIGVKNEILFVKTIKRN